MAATILNMVGQVRFPDFTEEGSPYVSSILYLSAVPVFAALIAARVASSRERVLPLARSLLIVACVASLAWITAEFLIEGSDVDGDLLGVAVALTGIVASAVLVVRTLKPAAMTQARRWAAAASAALALLLLPCLSLLDDRLFVLSSQYAVADHGDTSVPTIDQERLWTSQPALVASAIERLDTASSGPRSAYVVTVAAGGSQHLFGREARLAQATLGSAFGAQQRSVIFANDEESLFKVPLAARSNIDSVLTAIGRRMDRSSDLVVLYLASHGNRKAELTTDLPNYQDLDPISAQWLASRLERAGIKRRIIIISACYSGTWIKPLATDDTVIVTAARADRTSFGCSDDRELTYFGEAILKGPLASGASLEKSFDTARRTVRRWEGGSTHSEPQAFVGRNMQAVWRAPTGARRVRR